MTDRPSRPRGRRATAAGALPAQLGERIAELAGLLGTRKKAAEIAGISTDQLARYIGTQSQPTFTPIARMAERAGVRLDWVWSGAGPKYLHAAKEDSGDYGLTDTHLLEQAVAAVEAALADVEHRLPPERKAELITAIYTLFGETGKQPDREMVLRLLKSLI